MATKCQTRALAHSTAAAAFVRRPLDWPEQVAGDDFGAAEANWLKNVYFSHPIGPPLLSNEPSNVSSRPGSKKSICFNEPELAASRSSCSGFRSIGSPSVPLEVAPTRVVGASLPKVNGPIAIVNYLMAVARRSLADWRAIRRARDVAALGGWRAERPTRRDKQWPAT